MAQNRSLLVEARPSSGFVETPLIREITERAISYVRCGFPVNFNGVSGTGKSTLALHVANKLGAPIVLMYGDEQFGSADLVGGMNGYHHRKVVDNFIHSVLKTEDEMAPSWVDSRLTVACEHGLTLVYDEFTRSRPEANNVLLSILEERVLPLPPTRGGPGYLRVHPSFSAIFTSNSEEYAGVHKTQDALRDRMVTIHLDYYDEDTEVAITQAKAGIESQNARRIVRLVRSMRETGSCRPTLRACIAIGKAIRLVGANADAGDSRFRHVCLDVLTSQSTASYSKVAGLVNSHIDKCCMQERVTA